MIALNEFLCDNTALTVPVSVTPSPGPYDNDGTPDTGSWRDAEDLIPPADFLDNYGYDRIKPLISRVGQDQTGLQRFFNEYGYTQDDLADLIDNSGTRKDYERWYAEDPLNWEFISNFAGFFDSAPDGVDDDNDIDAY